ncbi:HAD family hydrolase [Chloroflexota bacterium]
MKIKAVFFDLGGVIVRTEDPGPRTNLAGSLGLSYAEIDRIVFENESSRQASLGLISEAQHWLNIAAVLKQPDSEAERLKKEFFAGDRVDPDLVKLIRGLRPAYKIGVISNAWSGMRSWLSDHDLLELFDDMVGSAEVGFAKPDQRIYQAALRNLAVKPGESVFIDDMLTNVEAARKIGMHAIHFNQPGQAINELNSLLEE